MAQDENKSAETPKPWPKDSPRVLLNISNGKVVGANVISPNEKITRHGDAGKPPDLSKSNK